MANDNEMLLSTKQAATILGIEPQTLCTKRWKGGGPIYIKMGKTVRYRMSDLRAYLDSHTVEPGKKPCSHQ